MDRAFLRRLACSTAGVLLSGLLSSSQLAAQGAPGPAGHWTGSTGVNGHALAIEVDLARADSGWSGVVAVPEQGAKDVPLTGIAIKGDSVVFEITGAMGQPTFRGTLQNGGQTMAGAFSQGMVNTTFTLTRGEAPAKAASPAGAEPARPAGSVPAAKP